MGVSIWHDVGILKIVCDLNSITNAGLDNHSLDRVCYGTKDHWHIYQHHPKYFTWRHKTETFSALLALYVGNSFVTGDFLQHKIQWCQALRFSVICAWINGWVNNCEIGNLGRHRAHYDVILMRSLAPVAKYFENGLFSQWFWIDHFDSVQSRRHLFCGMTG